jgi:hypothetical protein
MKLMTMFSIASVGLLWAAQAQHGVYAPVLGHLVTVSGPSPYRSCPYTVGSPNINLVGPGGVRPEVEAESQLASTSHGVLVAAWIQDNGLGLVAATSRNGGATWTVSPLPFTQCAPNGLDDQQTADPWVSLASDGRAYAVGMVLKYRRTSSGTDVTVREGVAESTSYDAGHTWQRPVILQEFDETTPPVHIADKPYVVADPTMTGAAYVVWSQSTDQKPPSQVWLAATHDGGRSWDKPHVILHVADGLQSANGNIIVPDANAGALHDVFILSKRHLTRRDCSNESRRDYCELSAIKSDSSIETMISTDHGATWSSPIRVAAVIQTHLTSTAGVISGESLPDATFDSATGMFYAVWSDGRCTPAHSGQIVFTHSKDGRTWSRPHCVGPLHRSFLPMVAADVAGYVGVTYYAFDKSVSRDGCGSVSYWFNVLNRPESALHRSIRIAGPFCLTRAPGSRLGDYEGLTTTGKVFHLLFVDTTGLRTNPTDVLTRTVNLAPNE